MKHCALFGSRLLATLALLSLFAVADAQTPNAQAQAAPRSAPNSAMPQTAPEAAPISGMKSLGGERYQIGAIVVDKKKSRLSIPGRVLQLGVPLEYLAVSPGGMKGYESLLEVNASGSEFNLACILLGLDASTATRPELQFGGEPLTGPQVAFRIVWIEGRIRHELAVPEALYADAAAAAKVSDAWIYTGSMMNAYSKRYAADETGVLVTFVHDATAVVSHRTGLGIGAYGSVSGNKALLPPVGGAVTLEMHVVGAGR